MAEITTNAAATAADALAAAAQESGEIIGREQARAALATLKKYKAGKAALEARVIEDEKWYRLQHQQILRSRAKGDTRPTPTSAWLFNTITNKHADAMDSYPEPNVFPREQSDEQDAKNLAAVLPVVLEQADFEQVYSDNWWEKLKHGTAIYSPVWDNELQNGMGDVSVRAVDMLNLFWEPGISDIQKSANVFRCELVRNEDLEARYPQLSGKLGGQSITLAEYDHDDSIDTTDMSVMVEWYYKRKVGTKTVLHYVQMVNDEVLFATENRPEYRERGWYDHGQYPFVFDILFPMKGSPAGFGFVAVCKDPQLYIDKLSGNILDNTGLATNPRYFSQDNNAVNMEDLLDNSKRIIPVSGSLDDLHLRKMDIDPVDGNSITVLQLKIDEMKETSGNRDVSSGSSSGGVTAASAIAALQEAGNKGSRDMISGAYRAYRRLDYMVLELMLQFYTEARYFRITAPNGAAEFITLASNQMGVQVSGIDRETGKPLYRRPIFDIKITAQKRSAISREVENQRASELYQMGFFDPNRAQEAMIALDMMEFEGKDKVMEKVRQGQTLMNVLQQMSMQMQQMAALLQTATGARARGNMSDGGNSGEDSGKSSGSGGGSGGGQNMGQAQSRAMRANSTPYAQQLAARAVPDMSGQQQGV